MSSALFSEIVKKNTAESSVLLSELDENISLAKVDNNQGDALQIKGKLDPELIQFYFCTKGSVTFSFLQGAYVRKLETGKSYLFYNPQGSLAHEIEVAPNTKFLALFISVKQLHHLFVHDSDELSFLNNQNANQRFYNESDISPALSMVIDQLFLVQTSASTQNLYYRGKIFEILSLYFSPDEDKDTEKCPFLLDEANVEKIRKAKKIILEKMADPPGLPHLAKMIGLNEYQLKVGFKNIYGTTVYKYLHEHKMEQSRKMLNSGHYRVNEVGFQVGYSNPSHFISAFKKKYGITPKKYLQLIGK